uniref:Uncharacterized protein n=1 Tax=Vitrella brassicaformis TaxID=1169539 RepID=A0A7S1KCB9_9ALVE
MKECQTACLQPSLVACPHTCVCTHVYKERKGDRQTDRTAGRLFLSVSSAKSSNPGVSFGLYSGWMYEWMSGRRMDGWMPYDFHSSHFLVLKWLDCIHLPAGVVGGCLFLRWPSTAALSPTHAYRQTTHHMGDFACMPD